MDGLKKVLQRDANDPRPLLVNFWATWCDPCREEFPDLVKIDAEYKSKGLNFITISLDDLADIKTEVPKFLRKMKATMPAYLLNVEDQSEAIALVSPNWGGGLPATFLFDANGQIVFSKTGIVRPDELKEAINKVLSSEF
jgi:thiol-disulfide isomerase/thioredoxin